MKKDKLENLLRRTREACGDTELRFAIQTNAILLDEGWLDLFETYDVYISVSLDGTKELNDTFRLDKKGQGTYERTIAGLNLASKRAEQGTLVHPGVLCVVNPHADAKAIFRHFAVDLKIKKMDFLFPDVSHENPIEPKLAVGNFLKDVFSEWLLLDDPDVKIRYIEQYIARFLTGTIWEDERQLVKGSTHHVITVTSDGEIAPDDMLRSVDKGLFENLHPVNSSSLEDYFKNEQLQEFLKAQNSLPKDCTDCLWKNVCRGSNHIIHRYKAAENYQNKSVYCEDMKLIFKPMAQYLVKNGIIDKKKLKVNLS